MNNRIIKKPIDRISSHGEMQGEIKRISSGIGHIILPNDMDRSEYINSVKMTGRAMIVTTFNSPITNVIVPKHILQEIVFPLSYKERGSCVYWNTVPVLNQVILEGIILQEDDIVPASEHEFIEIKEFERFSISELKNTTEGVYITSVKNESGNTGKLVLRAMGNEKLSSVSVDCNGVVSIDTHEGVFNVEESLQIFLGSKEGEKSSLTISKEGVVSYTDRYGNDLIVDEEGVRVKMKSGKLGISNDAEVLRTLVQDVLKMYIDTKTIDGKVLDPSSTTTATNLIIRFNKLLKQ